MWTFNDGLCIYSPDGCNLGFSLVEFAVGQIEISLEDFARPLETPECADSRIPSSGDLALKALPSDIVYRRWVSSLPLNLKLEVLM
jgi:hypothetical protein